LTPRLTARYTYYTQSCPKSVPWCRRDFNGGALSRQSLEGLVNLAGPKFSRIYRGPSGYSDLIKHEIGPELVYVYRTATDNFSQVAQFDELDNTARAHELRVGLVQRLVARRKTAAGGLRPFEMLNWNVYRKYYFWSPLSAYDRDFLTQLWDNVAAKPPDDLRRSPIHSQLRLAPVESWSVDWLQEYDTGRKKTTRLDLSTTLRSTSGRLRGTWSRSPARYDDDEAQTLLVPEQNSLNGEFSLAIGKKFLEIGAAASYSMVESSFYHKGFISRSVHARIDAQCIGIELVYRQMALYAPGANEKQKYAGSFSFAISLGDLGSIGMDTGRAGGLGLSGSRIGDL
jgi:hypothetical protein